MSIQYLRNKFLTKKIRITEEACSFLEDAKLPSEDFNDTLLRLIWRYDQIEFIKSQKQILEEEEFLSLDESE
jgi:predicted CopG family antitoxin